MAVLEPWMHAAALVMQWQNLLLILGLSVLGLVIGFLPGLGPLTALTLFIPITFGMTPAMGITVLGVLYMSVIYGGSISSILLNTPGTASSAATCFDGYPMAQQGRGNEAIGISMMSSFIGGFVGLAGLVFLSPIVANLVFLFHPPEYFSLSVLGLVLISASSGKSMAKALVSGALGALVSTVGLDIMTAHPRFTFGSYYLMGGIPFIPLIIGLFSFSQVLSLMQKGRTTIAEGGAISGNIWEGLRTPFRYPGTLVRASLVGLGIGVIPGEGAAVANFTAYLVEVRASRHPELFGTGLPEGIIAPETSNNACVPGSLIPTLTLGIPGGGVAAIMMGGLMIHGISPGWELYSTHSDILYALYFGMFLANFLIFLCGVSLARYIARVTVVPVTILAPAIIILGVVSTYLIRQNATDIIVAIIAGVVGYFMNRWDYSSVPFLVAFILSPIAEKNFFQALMISDGSHMTFFTSPGSAILLTVTLLVIVVPPLTKKIMQRRGGAEVSAGK